MYIPLFSVPPFHITFSSMPLPPPGEGGGWYLNTIPETLVTVVVHLLTSVMLQSPRWEIENRLAQEREEQEARLQALRHQLEEKETLLKEERALHANQLEVISLLI